MPKQKKQKKTANGHGGESATNASEENLRPVTRRQTRRNQQQETTPEERKESQHEGSSETQDEVPGRQQNTRSQSEAAPLTSADIPNIAQQMVNAMATQDGTADDRPLGPGM